MTTLLMFHVKQDFVEKLDEIFINWDLKGELVNRAK